MAIQCADPNLPHIGLVGDTYTILVAGRDTAGRYCLVDMHIPPGGGPPPHRHDFEEMFSVLGGEIEVTFRGKKTVIRAGETINIPANAPHQFQNKSDQPAHCYACARRPGRKSFSKKSAFPLRRGQRRHPRWTWGPRQRSWRRSKPLLRNTEPSFCSLRLERHRAHENTREDDCGCFRVSIFRC